MGMGCWEPWGRRSWRGRLWVVCQISNRGLIEQLRPFVSHVRSLSLLQQRSPPIVLRFVRESLATPRFEEDLVALLWVGLLLVDWGTRRANPQRKNTRNDNFQDKRPTDCDKNIVVDNHPLKSWKPVVFWFGFADSRLLSWGANIFSRYSILLRKVAKEYWSNTNYPPPSPSFAHFRKSLIGAIGQKLTEWIWFDIPDNPSAEDPTP